MWMCQSVIAKCEDIIERMDNCVRVPALAATFSLRTKLCESLRMQAMNMIGDRLISHKDFRHNKAGKPSIQGMSHIECVDVFVSHLVVLCPM